MKKEAIKREEIRIKTESLNERGVIEGTATITNQENDEKENDEDDDDDLNDKNSSGQQSEIENKERDGKKNAKNDDNENEKDLKSLLPSDFDGLIQDVVLCIVMLFI